MVNLGRLRVQLLALGAGLSSVTNALPEYPTQWRLAGDQGRIQSPPRSSATVIRQNESVCDAGSSQWSGTVPLGKDRSMFFWYFESRQEPENAPLIVWLNGGPGASSMLGAFFEIGPCVVTEDGEDTQRNDLSWTNFANMLFIDQPIGAGFSETADPSLWAANLVEAGLDFDKFLDTFLDDLFPTLRDRAIHIAGESFGGKYVPIYTSMTRHKIDSIILVNALVNMPQTVLGKYEHFCVPFPTESEEGSRNRFNASSCNLMEEGYSQCDKFSRMCDLTYDTDTCFTAFEKCLPLEMVFQREVSPGGRHPYDDRLICEEPPLCGKLGMEPVSKYLNKDTVQNALGFKEKFDFRPVNMDLNAQWSTQSDSWVPSTREIAEILDSKHIKVLVLNGNNDIIVNTEGVIKSYDAMLWSGHAGFQAEVFKPWHYQDAKGARVTGGTFKTKGNLTLVTVDEAGHMSPRDQPKAVLEVVRSWTGH